MTRTTLALATLVAALLLAGPPVREASAKSSKRKLHECIFAAHGSKADHARNAKGGIPGAPDKPPKPGGDDDGPGGKHKCGKTFAKWNKSIIAVFVDATDPPTAALGTALGNFVNDSKAEWSCYSGLGDVVVFETVFNEADADIVVKWENLGSTGILGSAQSFFIGNDLDLSVIRMNSNAAVGWTAGPAVTHVGGCHEEVADDASETLFDLLSVTLHEFGHALGQDHPNGRCSTRDKCYKETMYSCTDPGQYSRRALDPGDQAAIESNYGVDL